MSYQLNISENKKHKICTSKNYNFIFNKETGEFARWGKTEDEDPLFAITPELADIELSTGSCLGKCAFCYKSNGPDGGHHPPRPLLDGLPDVHVLRLDREHPGLGGGGLPPDHQPPPLPGADDLLHVLHGGGRKVDQALRGREGYIDVSVYRGVFLGFDGLIF